MLAGIESRDQELRQALAAREEALGDARNARDFLKITLASIGDAVISTDAERKVVFATPVVTVAALKLFIIFGVDNSRFTEPGVADVKVICWSFDSKICGNSWLSLT